MSRGTRRRQGDQPINCVAQIEGGGDGHRPALHDRNGRRQKRQSAKSSFLDYQPGNRRTFRADLDRRRMREPEGPYGAKAWASPALRQRRQRSQRRRGRHRGRRFDLPLKPENVYWGDPEKKKKSAVGRAIRILNIFVYIHHRPSISVRSATALISEVDSAASSASCLAAAALILARFLCLSSLAIGAETTQKNDPDRSWHAGGRRSKEPL